MDGGIQPTYNLADRGYGYGDGLGFGGSGLWLFAILALMWGGNGLWGNRNEGRCATVEDLNNSTNFARLESQVQGIGSNMLQKYDNLNNGICSLGYGMSQQFFGISREISESQAKTSAEIQSIKDMMYQNKIEALQGKISALELAQATSGLVRYPCTMAYNAGTSPFCNGGCCGGYGNI